MLESSIIITLKRRDGDLNLPLFVCQSVRPSVVHKHIMALWKQDWSQDIHSKLLRVGADAGESPRFESIIRKDTHKTTPPSQSDSLLSCI